MAAAARLLLSKSVARVWHRQGVQPPERLGRPSGQGKTLWKTSKVLMRSVRTGFEPFCRFAAEKREIVYITCKSTRNGVK